MKSQDFIKALYKAANNNGKLNEAAYVCDVCSIRELEYIAAADDINDLYNRLDDLGFDDTVTRELIADALNF